MLVLDAAPTERNASASINPLQLSELIGHIYAAAGDANLWPQLLSGLGRYLEQVHSTTTNESTADAQWVGRQSQELLASMTAHFLRAQQLHQQLQQADVLQQRLQSVMNLLPLGMALVDGDGAVHTMNRALQSLLDDCQGLCIEAGRLQSQPAARLQTALNELAQGKRSDYAMRLHSYTDQALSLWVSTVSGLPGNFMVLVASVQSRALSEPGLRTLFNLTTAEARLTQQLALGLSLDESAQTLQVSRNTVRTHLRSVFAKLGVKRQAELIQCIYASPLWLQTSETLPTSHDKLLTTDVAVPGRTLSLSDGRVLSYAEYGAAQGQPVLLLHAIVGSRVFRYPNDAWLLDRNIRLIIPERPGHGDSDAQPQRQVSDTVQDVHALLEHLQIQRVGLLGYSAGVQYALAIAQALPERIAQVACVAAMPPVAGMGDLRWYPPVFRMVLLIAHYAPALLSAVLRTMVKGIRNNVYQYLNEVLTQASQADQRLFVQPRLRTLYASSLFLGARQGEAALAMDVQLAAQAWSVDAGNLPMPVCFWHGESDPLVNIQGARLLADRLPAARFITVPDAGHYVLFTRWRDILQYAAQGELPS